MATNWLYHTAIIQGDTDPAIVTATLDALGAIGWELVTAVVSSDGFNYVYTFKKDKP